VEPVAECLDSYLPGKQSHYVGLAEGAPTGDSSGSWAILIDRFVKVLADIGSDWQVHHATIDGDGSPLLMVLPMLSSLIRRTTMRFPTLFCPTSFTSGFAAVLGTSTASFSKKWSSRKTRKSSLTVRTS